MVVSSSMKPEDIALAAEMLLHRQGDMASSVICCPTIGKLLPILARKVSLEVVYTVHQTASAL
jgi:hypothetical protein